MSNKHKKKKPSNNTELGNKNSESVENNTQSSQEQTQQLQEQLPQQSQQPQQPQQPPQPNPYKYPVRFFYGPSLTHIPKEILAKILSYFHSNKLTNSPIRGRISIPGLMMDFNFGLRR